MEKYDFNQIENYWIDVIHSHYALPHAVSAILAREISKKSIFQYIEIYYNRFRSHSSIGFVSPETFENQYKKTAFMCLQT